MEITKDQIGTKELDQLVWDALDKLYARNLMADEAFDLVIGGSEPEFEVLRALPRDIMRRWASPNYG